tara:strand:+ start:32 stop:217 length:186 start_codon:yes stop_codon:yes gene_type:complete
MNISPIVSGNTDLQGIDAITMHIEELCNNYLKTNSPIIIDLIREWQFKRKIKQEEQDERCN